MEFYIRVREAYEPVVGYCNVYVGNGVITDRNLYEFTVLNKGYSSIIEEVDLEKLIPFDEKIYKKLRAEYALNKAQNAIKESLKILEE